MVKGKTYEQKLAPVPVSTAVSVEDDTPERFFVLKAALLSCHRSGYKEVLDLAEMISPTEHQFQRFRHKIFDVMNEQEKAMRGIIAQMLQEVQAK